MNQEKIIWHDKSPVSRGIYRCIAEQAQTPGGSFELDTLTTSVVRVHFLTRLCLVLLNIRCTLHSQGYAKTLNRLSVSVCVKRGRTSTCYLGKFSVLGMYFTFFAPSHPNTPPHAPAMRANRWNSAGRLQLHSLLVPTFKYHNLRYWIRGV